MISKERLKGNWNSIAGTIKEKFGQITDDELQRAEGNLDQLVGLLQRKAGMTREQASEFVSDCSSSMHETVNRLTEQAGEYAEAASEAVRENYDRVAEAAQAGYQQTARAVSKRPVESLALAVGVGVLAGLAFGLSLTSRRR